MGNVLTLHGVLPIRYVLLSNVRTFKVFLCLSPLSQLIVVDIPEENGQTAHTLSLRPITNVFVLSCRLDTEKG